MKLYRVTTLHGGYIWVGTQADAKRISKEEHVAGYEDVDVPTDKAGLLDWLNETSIVSDMPIQSEHDLLEQAEDRAIAAATPARSSMATMTDLEEFILDTASTAQVEKLFACIGTRFAELRSDQQTKT